MGNYEYKRYITLMCKLTCVIIYIYYIEMYHQ